jgi:hypothetical protein
VVKVTSVSGFRRPSGSNLNEVLVEESDSVAPAQISLLAQPVVLSGAGGLRLLPVVQLPAVLSGTEFSNRRLTLPAVPLVTVKHT